MKIMRKLFVVKTPISIAKFSIFMTTGVRNENIDKFLKKYLQNFLIS